MSDVGAKCRDITAEERTFARWTPARRRKMSTSFSVAEILARLEARIALETPHGASESDKVELKPQAIQISPFQGEGGDKPLPYVQNGLNEQHCSNPPP